jgi:hypothetical protein
MPVLPPAKNSANSWRIVLFFSCTPPNGRCRLPAVPIHAAADGAGVFMKLMGNEDDCRSDEVLLV